MQNQSGLAINESLERDFSRNIWCVLGLPFDAITMDQAIEAVILAAAKHNRLFISTPNLNFLCAAQTDAIFRQSVINSDLSVADGMPIILLARLLNIPIVERVAGSDLIHCLSLRKTKKPIKVFFFGGSPGVAEQASKNLNQLDSGLFSIGYYEPGFGSVTEMSSEAIIDEINSYDSDFLIVSLGAKKGQEWIEKNRDKLNAPIVSHLGAVVNFFAGTVKRAPLWMQRCGLEWFWRIYQEPGLWKRYYNDGAQLIKMLGLYIFPYWLFLRFHKSNESDSPNKIIVMANNQEINLFQSENIPDSPISDSVKVLLTGSFCKHNNESLRLVFKKLALSNINITVDLSSATFIDGGFVGLCLLLEKYLLKSEKTLSLINASTTVTRILCWNRVGYMLYKKK
jgi:N-acetylglucosaminyldiphosphoundecaprenol N-acetyl-beta-D-mannosaminyltransferase